MFDDEMVQEWLANKAAYEAELRDPAMSSPAMLRFKKAINGTSDEQEKELWALWEMSPKGSNGS